MKIIAYRTGEKPVIENIENDIHIMQEFVGGCIEVVHPWPYDPVALVCCETGKIDGLPANRYIKNSVMNDIIAGNFFIAGIGIDDFTDIPSHLIDRYMNEDFVGEKAPTYARPKVSIWS